MALCCKVDNRVKAFFLKQAVDGAPISDIAVHKAQAGIVQNLPERFQIPGIGQGVETDDAAVRPVLQQIVDKIASDKTGTAGY